MIKTRKIVALLIALVMLFSITTPANRKTKVKAADESFAINLSVYKSANSQARLSWNAVPNATGYDVQCRRETGDWKNDADYRSGTAYTSTDLLNIVYYFHVRAKFSDGSCSDWAEVWVNVSNGAVSPSSGNNSIMIKTAGRTSTNTGDLIDPPVIKKGLNVSYQEGQTITLEWDAVPNATHYWMYFYRLEDSSTEAYVVKGWLQDTRLDITLPAGTYEVLPQAQNSRKPHSWNPDWWQTTDGVRGSFSVVAKKTEDTRNSSPDLTEAPVIKRGLDVCYNEGTTITLEWNAVPNATHYWMYFYRLEDSSTEAYEVKGWIEDTKLEISLPVGTYEVLPQAQNCNKPHSWNPDWWQTVDGVRGSFSVVSLNKSVEDTPEKTQKTESGGGTIVKNQKSVTYTKEALFSLYPNYLDCKESDRRIGELVEPAIELLNENTNWGRYLIGGAVTVIDSGLDILMTNVFNALAPDLVPSTQDQYRMELAQNAVERLLDGNDYEAELNKVLKPWKKVSGDWKTVKKVADRVTGLSKSVDFDKLLLSESDMKKLLASEAVKKAEVKCGETAIDFFELFVTTLQMYELNADLISVLIENTPEGSDLRIGLELLYKELERNPVDYIIRTMYKDTVISVVAASLKELGTVVLGSNGNMIVLGLKFAAKHMYDGASLEGLIKAGLAHINYLTSQIAFQEYEQLICQNKVVNGEATYELLYNFHLATTEEFLYQAASLANQHQQLLKNKADANRESLEDGLYMSYPIYLKLCTEKLNEDSKSGRLGQANNDEGVIYISGNLSDRMAIIQQMYPANIGIAFSERYGNSIGAMAFTERVFNLLFDCDMPDTTQNQFRYQLYGSQNVKEIGLIRQADMSLANVTNLLKKAQFGDVLLGYGDKGQHSMIIVGNENGVLTVYDCDSPYGPSDSKNLIQKYEIGFADIQETFSTSSNSRLHAGIALYREVNQSEEIKKANSKEGDTQKQICEIDHTKCSATPNSNFKNVCANGKWKAVCRKCGEEFVLGAINYKEAGAYKVTKKCNVCAAPYNDSKKKTLKANKTVVIIGSVKNAYGNKWMLTVDGSWISSEKLTKKTSSCKHKKYITVALPDGSEAKFCSECGKKK